MTKLEVSRYVVAIPCFAPLPTVLVGPYAIAQTTYGRIVGTAHALSPAATPAVRDVDQATGVNVAQDPNDSGAYSFTTLFTGNYTIHAETTGLLPVDMTGIHQESAVASSWWIDIPMNRRCCLPARPVGATGRKVHHDA